MLFQSIKNFTYLLPKSLKGRLIIFPSVATIFIFILMGVVAGYFQYHTLYNQLIRHTNILGKEIAYSIQTYLLLDDYAEAESAMSRFCELDSITALSLINAEGKILIEIEKDSNNKLSKKYTLIETYSSLEIKKSVYTDKSKSIVLFSPLVKGAETWWIRVEIDKSYMYSSLLNLFLFGVFLVLFFLLIFIFTVINILNRPIQEIGKLTEFSSNLGDQFGLKIDIVTQVYEIQALAYSLNKLSQKLYSNKTIMLEQQEKLQQFNDELWKQVEEETRKNREKDAILVQQSRLAALGEMIGNIAHQWRQPLNAIAIEIQDLDLSYQLGELSDKEVSISTQEIMKHVLYLSQTIDDFRDLVQANKCYEPFLVSEVIFKILELMSSTFKASSIKLVLHIDESIIANHGSSQGLSQAIINILSNAKDILVQNNSENEREITLRLSQVLNDNFSKTVLSIEDNGGGIESDIVSKIFDPYFTTKHQSQGTGLGLYISKNIIEQELLGTLQVVATKHGTLFSIEWDS